MYNKKKIKMNEGDNGNSAVLAPVMNSRTDVNRSESVSSSDTSSVHNLPNEPIDVPSQQPVVMLNSGSDTNKAPTPHTSNLLYSVHSDELDALCDKNWLCRTDAKVELELRFGLKSYKPVGEDIKYRGGKQLRLMCNGCDTFCITVRMKRMRMPGTDENVSKFFVIKEKSCLSHVDCDPGRIKYEPVAPPAAAQVTETGVGAAESVESIGDNATAAATAVTSDTHLPMASPPLKRRISISTHRGMNGNQRFISVSATNNLHVTGPAYKPSHLAPPQLHGTLPVSHSILSQQTVLSSQEQYHLAPMPTADQLSKVQTQLQTQQQSQQTQVSQSQQAQQSAAEQYLRLPRLDSSDSSDSDSEDESLAVFLTAPGTAATNHSGSFAQSAAISASTNAAVSGDNNVNAQLQQQSSVGAQYAQHQLSTSLPSLSRHVIIGSAAGHSVGECVRHTAKSSSAPSNSVSAEAAAASAAMLEAERIQQASVHILERYWNSRSDAKADLEMHFGEKERKLISEDTKYRGGKQLRLICNGCKHFCITTRLKRFRVPNSKDKVSKFFVIKNKSRLEHFTEQIVDNVPVRTPCISNVVRHYPTVTMTSNKLNGHPLHNSIIHNSSIHNSSSSGSSSSQNMEAMNSAAVPRIVQLAPPSVPEVSSDERASAGAVESAATAAAPSAESQSSRPSSEQESLQVEEMAVNSSAELNTPAVTSEVV